MPSLSATLNIARLALGPVMAALILWAASALYSDPLLSGFIYALCVLLLGAYWALSWLAEGALRKTPPPPAASIERFVAGIFLACVLVPLAYAALPLPLVAAAVLILCGAWAEMFARGAEAQVNELGRWRTSAELAGLAAFMGARAATLLDGQQSVILGLDWSAAILLWVAAALALTGGAIQTAAALRRT